MLPTTHLNPALLKKYVDLTVYTVFEASIINRSLGIRFKFAKNLEIGTYSYYTSKVME